MIAHIVLFTPKRDMTDQQRWSFAKTVLDVCSVVPSVRKFSVGRRVDVDPGYGRFFGEEPYEYAAVLEFDSEDDLVNYLKDARHHALGQLFWNSCERTVVTEVRVTSSASDEDVEFLAKRPN